MPSKTPSPYSRPWSNTETTAVPRSYHVPSIHTMEGIGRNLAPMSPPDNGGRGGPGGRGAGEGRGGPGSHEAAGDRTQDLRIKSSGRRGDRSHCDSFASTNAAL